LDIDGGTNRKNHFKSIGYKLAMLAWILDQSQRVEKEAFFAVL
jgi:hypothetical protein